MRLTTLLPAAGAAFAFAALLLWPVINAPTVHAQVSPPATYFGTGMTPGEEVEALIGGESCGTATVTAAGEWVIVVQPGAPCQPSQGADVTFTVNGAPAAESETWRPGGVPADLVAGMTLTVGEPAPKPLPVPAVSAFAGDLPAEDFGLVTFGGSVDELKAALAVECASGAPIFATVGGGFVAFFPTAALSAPNAAFHAMFSGDAISAGTPLLGGNCGA